MRFIHAADIYLDTSFSSRSDSVRSRLRDTSRVAFERMVDLALLEQVDTVLLAGDLFDDDRLSFQTERFLLEQLYRLKLAEIPVVYATGNHDPGLSRGNGSVRGAGRSADLAWPDNVTVAGSSQPVRLTI
jgi:exonuclease SbcD